jgi:hypothetical protein
MPTWVSGLGWMSNKKFDELKRRSSVCKHEKVEHSWGYRIAWLFPVPREYHEWKCYCCGMIFSYDPRQPKENIEAGKTIVQQPQAKTAEVDSGK